MGGLLLMLCLAELSSAGGAILHGRILDIDDKPVAGAEVYAFDSANVKRPANFISSRTSDDGEYRISLGPGRYWTVAIFRKGGGRFGPLGIEDKHSGDPVVLELGEDAQVSRDFTVFDLREAARKHRKKSEDLMLVRGTIVDAAGRLSDMAYAMAGAKQRIGEVPDSLSAWTGGDGAFEMYLPKGTFYIGASQEFPPEKGFVLPMQIEISGDVRNVVLELKTEDN